MNKYAIAAMQRARTLKSAEKQYRARRGPNPLLPTWTDTPRSGARWSEAEEDELKSLVARWTANGDKLTPWNIADLAWLFGRSADAIDQRLKSILGWPDYNSAVVLQ